TPRFLDISRHFTVHLFRPWMPRSTRCQHFLRSAERRGLETTAVNIFEGRRNLLWVKDLKQLITYCKSNMSSMKIIGYIVNANLIVILGDMDKDRATPDRPDNPLSKCRHASNDLHGSGQETRAQQRSRIRTTPAEPAAPFRPRARRAGRARSPTRWRPSSWGSSRGWCCSSSRC